MHKLLAIEPLYVGMVLSLDGPVALEEYKRAPFASALGHIWHVLGFCHRIESYLVCKSYAWKQVAPSMNILFSVQGRSGGQYHLTPKEEWYLKRQPLGEAPHAGQLLI